MAFVAGEIADRAAIEEHIDDCANCRQLLAELVRKHKTTDRGPATDETAVATDKDPKPPPLDPNEWPSGERIGRYVVLARIGRGGMGTVYRAEDVELGRPVALKKLHANADSESRARLVREARSAAQLQHPNVVTVHEVAEHKGTPFLAMELVDGVTLTSWLKDKTRTWREIVDIVSQAGRGLAAAHDRGLVHRDFKPDNVLVDRTGRARVADFGLARAGDATPSEPRSPISHDTRLTATGSLAGTPAYMSPELVEGAAPDARSDQYAFAITLYEALRGQHPFEGNTAARLWVEMASGRIRPGGRSVPAWLDKHARRGLEVDPSRRWPDVASFVAAIGKPPRKTLFIAGGAGAAVLAGTVAVLALRSPASSGSSGPTCDALANEYKQNFEPGDLARAIPDAKQLAQANARIDQFTKDFRNAVRESCRATRAGTQSAAIGDKRSACLELAKRRAWFVTSGLTTGIDTRPGLATLLEELPDISACNDPTWLERSSPLPVAQADREALYLAESNLFHATEVRDQGHLDQASMLVKNAIDTSQRLSDKSLEARAYLFNAELHKDRGDGTQAQADAFSAWSAASMTGDNTLTLKAQMAMLDNRTAVDSFKGIDKAAESADGAKLVATYGMVLLEVGRFKEGEAQLRRAQAIREKVLPAEHVERVLGQQKIGAALALQKKAKEAHPILVEANAKLEKLFPPLRREAIDGLRYLAMAEEELGNLDKALEIQREVLARRTKVTGARSFMALDAKKTIAHTLTDLGKRDEAITTYNDVIEGLVDLYGERAVNISDVRVSLAQELISAGRIAEADELLAKAIPVLERANGMDSPYTMVGHYAQVRSWLERPKPIKLDEATKALDTIQPAFAKMFGESSQPVAAMLNSRARIAIAKGDKKTAGELLDRALTMVGPGRDRDELLALKTGKPVKTAPAATAGAVVAPPAPAPTGKCAKAGNRILGIWPGDERELIAGWYAEEPEEGEKILTMIDQYVEDWKAQARAACEANNASRTLCLHRIRERAAARIKNRGNGTKAAIVGRSSLPSWSHCAASTETVPADEKSLEAIQVGEMALEYARIMFEIKYWNAVHRNITWTKDQLRKYEDPSIKQRLEKLEAELAVAQAADKAAKAKTP